MGGEGKGLHGGKGGTSLEGCMRKDISTCWRKAKPLIPDREAGKTDQQKGG